MTKSETYTIALLPGSGQQPESMHPLAHPYAEMGYQVETLEFPVSDVTKNIADYTDIGVEALKTKHNIILEAHSMGGRVGVRVADALQDRVIGLILINSPVERPGNVPEPTEPDPPKYMPGYLESRQDDETGLRFVFKPEMVGRYVLSGCSPEGIEVLTRQMVPQVKDIEVSPLDNFPNVPTLGVYGLQDGAVNPEYTKVTYERYATTVEANAGRLAIGIPGGHFLQYTSTQRLKGEVFKFLYSLRHPESADPIERLVDHRAARLHSILPKE
jgi:pimeloyl-ACP methyl ester carboxylesterase